MGYGNIDFDGKDGRKLTESLYQQAKVYQQARNNGYKRFYHQYHGYLDTVSRDPNMSNIFIPKLFSSVETVLPREVNAVFGVRPYIPIEAAGNREDYKEVAEYQTEFHDVILNKAGFLEKMVLAEKMKFIYGTSFVEPLPYFETVMEKHIVPDPYTGAPTIQEVPALRYRLDIRVYAPWEVFVDPFAINLSDPNGCRYIVLNQLVSRRQLIAMAKKGAYGQDFDVQTLIDYGKDKSYSPQKVNDHFGLQILSDMGLPTQSGDSDIGVLMRVMMPDRYIDSFNGTIPLRDGDNRFEHKLINMSRLVNTPDPHTQNQFWGIGMAEMSELLIDLENDLFDMTLDAHAQANQPMIYYRKGAVSPENMIKTPGNRVPVDPYVMSDSPIKGNLIYESPGSGLPPDHYRLPSVIENKIDMVHGDHGISRSEPMAGVETAAEAAILKQGDEVRLSVGIIQTESFLSDFANKVFYHSGQFATMDDYVEILGQEKALRMQYANPNELPGGFNFAYKGKDKILNIRGRQRMIAELLPILANNPSVMPGGLAMWVLDTYEIPKAESAKFIVSDEEMMAKAQEQADMDAAMGTREDVSRTREIEAKGSVEENRNKMKEAGRAQGIQKKSEHTTLQEGQNSAKKQREDAVGKAV